jgi:hypothetical protein
LVRISLFGSFLIASHEKARGFRAATHGSIDRQSGNGVTGKGDYSLEEWNVGRLEKWKGDENQGTDKRKVPSANFANDTNWKAKRWMAK